ncbi:MAG: triose-phosphate isomerase [Bacteroidetes bacterium]|nr:triose-phosphate isomerase [Bacteroidota bacterium]
MLIAGNWKMNTEANSAVELTHEVMQQASEASPVLVAICPPDPLLVLVNRSLKESRVRLGAQNMHWADSGAFTGETSSSMLQSVGCHYVILGHSERRQYFAETDQEVSKKVKKAIQSGLIPIICVGEKLDQRKSGKEQEVVAHQVKYALEGITVKSSNAVVIAYEPVWAIGTGETATPEQAQEMHLFIRGLVEKQFGNSLAAGIHILYGGSMNPTNAKDLLSQRDVNGGLIGGASLKPDSFGQIIQVAKEVS